MRTMTVREWFRRCLSVQAPTDDEPDVSTHVGQLELAGFQRRAARRAIDIARTFGGVVLADAVGLGKTRVALAVARALMRDQRLCTGSGGALMLCVPARLAAQWRRAAARAGLDRVVGVSHTQLSRGQVPSVEPAVIIADEAHRFRNPTAKRSRALARLASKAPIVLATATPVCNDTRDLYHLLSLFLAEHDLRGAIGHDLSEAFELADAGAFDLTELVERVVIRRVESPGEAGFGRRPDVKLEVLEYRADEAERWLWQNLEAELARLEMALFERDWPRGLFVEYVLKRWESGPRALAETLGKLVDFHRRWLEADAHGRRLTRVHFRQLFGDAMAREQVVFPFLFEPAERSKEDSDPERRRVQGDLDVLEGLKARVADLASRGGGKADAIVALADGHRGKLLVFTGYVDAAHELYDRLVDGLGPRARVGLVTGAVARATGLGRASAREVIERFAPRSNGLEERAQHQQLDVLVSTDCLSEGVNLQDCGHVVLADLPYSPLSVEQRIGRLVRPGGPHDRVTVYLPRPRAWSDSLGMRRRLDRKLAGASATGAGFVTADKLATGDRPDDDAHALGPLAALTRLDHLISSLDAAAAGPIERGFFRARVHRGPPRLWARVMTRDEASTRWSWCLVRQNEAPKMRLYDLLDDLVCDCDLRAPVERAEPDGWLFEAALEAVERRQTRLRAARLAPLPVRLDAPQRRLWAAITAAVEAGELEVDADRLAGLRHGLLRSFPRGAERRLEGLVEADLAARRVFDEVCRITEGVPVWQPEVELEVVAALAVG